ncbi:MAG: glycosyl transferase [Candidatus Glassbacteria bacterium]|nr:glycosyl transferase [Candidatus Glassbacteria bacterium]
MSDFYQHPIIATLHRLGKPSLEKLEEDLVQNARRRPIALIIPVTLEDSRQAVFDNILAQLAEVPYLKRYVFTVGCTESLQEYASIYHKVKGAIPEATLIWAGSPRIRALIERMEASDLHIGGDGKGRSVWLAYGYIIAMDDCRVMALHDADIVNYDRELLARLVFPVASVRHNYEFSKGYYSRVADRMYGRVTRLFITPLIRAFQDLLGPSNFLTYMDAFRYPLAGEFAVSDSLARSNKIPGDWGLEIGTLAEVYRNCAHKRICQVDIAENYEHKHQELGQEGKPRGLSRMTEDIAKVFFRTLASQGAVFSSSSLHSLIGIYRRQTYIVTEHHEADAAINGLHYDRHSELIAVDTFARSLVSGGEAFFEDPMGPPQIPNWNRVLSADHAFLKDVVKYPELDMKEAANQFV